MLPLIRGTCTWKYDGKGSCESVVLKEGWSLISEAVHQGGLSSGLSFIRVVSSGWYFIRVVSHQRDPALIRDVFIQKGRSSWKSFIMRVDFLQGGLAFIRMVFHQGDL